MSGQQTPSPNSEPTTEQQNQPSPETQNNNRSAQTRQMLGMRGADYKETSIWKIRLQLMKPITWVPLVWGVVCGAAASGNFSWTIENILLAIACMTLSGPLLAGYTQTMNDFFDREIDAINEPYRPIPAGAIGTGQVVAQILVLLAAGLGLAYFLDWWVGNDIPSVTAVAGVGSFLAYIYSAPPLKLKRNGWLGNYALGASYIALPWCAGHALFGTLNLQVIFLTMFYSFAGLGIAIVNDFKSVQGDRELGLKSIPVMFGTTAAVWICALTIDLFQIGVAGYLISLQQNLYATILLLMVIPQITFQDMYLLRDPVNNDVKYQANAQPFLVLGILVTALAVGQNGGI